MEGKTQSEKKENALKKSATESTAKESKTLEGTLRGLNV